jgi:hypothetical protein
LGGGLVVGLYGVICLPFRWWFGGGFIWCDLFTF